MKKLYADTQAQGGMPGGMPGGAGMPDMAEFMKNMQQQQGGGDATEATREPSVEEVD